MIRRSLQHGKDKKARRKESGDWVTPFDTAAEEMIIDKLRYYFPQHSILGEEGGLQGKSKECWVIDPLDGTTNFVHGVPCCMVSIAFCRDGLPEVSVIYDIANDELYTAARGRGAFLEDKRLRIDKKVNYAESLLIMSGQVGREHGKIWQLLGRLASECEGARRTGSTVLDLAWLAAGRVEAVVSGPVQFWDVAAGALLVREAGGLISDVNERTRFVFNQRTAHFVAANPHIFARIFYETKTFCQAQQWCDKSDREAVEDKDNNKEQPS